jgi:hypothetical protein
MRSHASIPSTAQNNKTINVLVTSYLGLQVPLNDVYYTLSNLMVIFIDGKVGSNVRSEKFLFLILI